MIIGMRGHDFGRLEPGVLANEISKAGFEAAQLAFTKAFPKPENEYLSPDVLTGIRHCFADAGIQIPVMGCYVSASDKSSEKLAEAKAHFSQSLRASVLLGAGCVGTETTHFTFPETERQNAYDRLCDFVGSVLETAREVDAVVGIEPVFYHTLNTPELAGQLLSDFDHDPHLKIILDLANLVTPFKTHPADQKELLEKCLSIFGKDICVLHIKDGNFTAEGKWENCPLGGGIMDWPNLFPILVKHLNHLCALREDVWPGLAARECALMHKWAETSSPAD